jgi:hypothetical protein
MLQKIWRHALQQSRRERRPILLRRLQRIPFNLGQTHGNELSGDTDFFTHKMGSTERPINHAFLPPRQNENPLALMTETETIKKVC